MTDEQLSRQAAKYEELRLAKADVEAKMERLKERICGELDRRGTKSVEHGGVKVTSVHRETVTVDPDQLRERMSAGLFKRVTKPVVVKEALEDAVARGRVDADDVAACSVVHVSSPWPKVTFTGRD